MCLEVFCHDKIGFTRELSTLLVALKIDLCGIEFELPGRIYVNVGELDPDVFSRLMAETRRINGVTDVRAIGFMPSERKHQTMRTLLDSIPAPLFSIDLHGRIALANQEALTLFGLSKEKIIHQPVDMLITDYNICQWLDQDEVSSHTVKVVIHQQDYWMDITPIYLDSNNNDGERLLVGAAALLKSIQLTGHQLQGMTINDDSGFEQIIAVSPRMRQVVEQARKLAMLDAPLLIVGETGTGKDIFARACHLRSARGKQPFMALNCASLPDEVAESELFGYAPGAYPNALEGKKGFFEQANGGTVFLDEIGEMSPSMQTKLLRFLNDGTFRRVGEESEVCVDVRVICATQKNLVNLVQLGTFREDLYYRLNVLTLALPPLRECLSDILPLVSHFVARFANEQGVLHPAFSPMLNTYLSQYHWPGNVRQLKNSIYRALTQLRGEELHPQDIILPEFNIGVELDDHAIKGSLDDICKRFECSVLTKLYRDYPSTRKLAKRLGVSHTAIANKLREYGLSRR